MTQVKAKVYYEISTGNILTNTSEMQGDVVETTKEEDMMCEQLKGKNIDEVDFIELPYGALNNVKSYKFNTETKTLEFTYFTNEELESIEKKKQETQYLNNSVSNISEYLKLDLINIADIGNYIIQKEQNKIIGVV